MCGLLGERACARNKTQSKVVSAPRRCCGRRRRPIVAHTFTDSLELISKNCGVVFVALPASQPARVTAAAAAATATMSAEYQRERTRACAERERQHKRQLSACEPHGSQLSAKIK